MIHGIGIDITKNERIEKAVLRWGDRFLKRIYGDDELTYCMSKANPYPSLSVRFAAKEAFIKAIGNATIGILNDVEVVHNEAGAPCLKLHNKAAELAGQFSVKSSHVSLSHEKEYSVAMVVLEK